EIQRIIREVDPPRPSTRLSSLGDGAKEVAEKRQTQIDDLTKQLKSELEWIPLKAMRKDRGQRYSTTTELASDIHNYLEHKPLVAAPESASYKLKKFINRNRRGVAASVVMLVLLLVGIITTTWQAVRATHAERLATDKAAVADATNNFLSGMLESADPD